MSHEPGSTGFAWYPLPMFQNLPLSSLKLSFSLILLNLQQKARGCQFLCFHCRIFLRYCRASNLQNYFVFNAANNPSRPLMTGSRGELVSTWSVRALCCILPSATHINLFLLMMLLCSSDNSCAINTQVWKWCHKHIYCHSFKHRQTNQKWWTHHTRCNILESPCLKTANLFSGGE